MSLSTPDEIAQAFHETYERLAVEYLPAVDPHHYHDKGLMVAVVTELLECGAIAPGHRIRPSRWRPLSDIEKRQAAADDVVERDERDA